MFAYLNVLPNKSLSLALCFHLPACFCTRIHSLDKAYRSLQRFVSVVRASTTTFAGQQEVNCVRDTTMHRGTFLVPS